MAVEIGLGRFGSAIALELTRRGTEVLAIDESIKVVQGLSGHLSGQLLDCRRSTTTSPSPRSARHV